MQRWLFVLGAAMAILALDGSLAQAADKGAEVWPDLGALFTRGTGAYLSPWKIITSWLLFLAWVRTTDWISQDAQAVKLRYLLWNAITFFTFFIFFLVLWLLPWFAVGMIFLVIAWAAPLTTYIFYRNSRVPNSDKVLTQKHIRRWAVRKLNSMGVKVAGEEEDGRDAGPDIQLTAMGAEERDNNINLLTARQSPAWNPARELLDETLAQRATHLMLDSSGESVAVRYQIDGVWHDRAPLPRPDGEAILAVVKQLAAFDLNNRRSRQNGKFGMQAAKDKFTCKITA
ncbi:MAG TPA: hypothetical protein VHV08_14390, partial [Pirellulales bacterium]|nr:hypothetical protein [Pirellulales bacterium]